MRDVSLWLPSSSFEAKPIDYLLLIKGYLLLQQLLTFDTRDLRYGSKKINFPHCPACKSVRTSIEVLISQVH